MKNKIIPWITQSKMNDQSLAEYLVMDTDKKVKWYTTAGAALHDLEEEQFPLIVTNLIVPPGAYDDKQLMDVWEKNQGYHSCVQPKDKYMKIGLHLINRLRHSINKKSKIVAVDFMPNDYKMIYDNETIETRALDAGANQYISRNRLGIVEFKQIMQDYL